MAYKTYNQLRTTSYNDTWITTVSNSNTDIVYQATISSMLNVMLKYAVVTSGIDISVVRGKGAVLRVQADSRLVFPVYQDKNFIIKNAKEVSFVSNYGPSSRVVDGLFISDAPYLMNVYDTEQVAQVFATPSTTSHIVNTWEEDKHFIDDQRDQWTSWFPRLHLGYRGIYTVELSFNYWIDHVYLESATVDITLNDAVIDTVSLTIKDPGVVTPFTWSNPSLFTKYGKWLSFKTSATGLTKWPEASMMYDLVKIFVYRIG